MRTCVFQLALMFALMFPAIAGAQITMYRPNAYGSHLYQFGPGGTSITTTLPNGYGGFNQYHYGTGRAPAFVQPLPTLSYYAPSYAPRFYGGYRPYYAPQPVYRPWGGGMGWW